MQMQSNAKRAGSVSLLSMHGVALVDDRYQCMAIAACYRSVSIACHACSGSYSARDRSVSV